MKQHIDLNSDMGEGFGPWLIGDGVDDEIMPLISSANIATGFHADDPNTMHRMVGLAAQHNVGVAHTPAFAIGWALGVATSMPTTTNWSTILPTRWER